jgi:deazaflavin-dependent oxidoreductase (nitroreductase family)
MKSRHMGVLADLDYRPKPPNATQRLVQRVASSGPGAWVFARTLYPVDKQLFERTGGRVTAPGLLAGLPMVMLSTTGAKSGKKRTMPLLGIPIGDDIAVIGSNYGQESTPGWVYNLEADPHAEVEYRGQKSSVLARPADDDESSEAFRLATPIYGGFEKYVERAAHRTIRVFVLESRD